VEKNKKPGHGSRRGPDTKNDCADEGKQQFTGLDWTGLLQSDNHWGSAVVSCCCQKLVAEAGDSSGTDVSRYQATAREEYNRLREDLACGRHKFVVLRKIKLSH
jgi:hypothetical protein